ncbi:T6SS immunity protein Tdi1 domain-containing protein [Polaromonas hydrogenivorans]
MDGLGWYRVRKGTASDYRVGLKTGELRFEVFQRPVRTKTLSKFERTYNQTDSVSVASAVSKLSPAVSAPAGVYNSGLITVLDDELGRKVLNDWQWLLVDAVGLASTWQGNIFFWSPKHSASFYLDTQRGKTTFVEESVDVLFNVFLTREGIGKDVLLEDSFGVIHAREGDLNYCECYIAKPWQMLGGSGELDTFGKGDMEVYMSLTGQTIRKIMSKS